MTHSPRILLAFLILCGSAGSAARAAEPKVEIGAGLFGVSVAFHDDVRTVIATGSSSFPLLQPTVYASLFLGRHVAIEPRVGFWWTATSGRRNHLFTVTGQLDYFIRGTAASSPYVFGAVGMVDGSGGGANTWTTVSGGIGHRMTLGDRLTFRVDARLTHTSEDVGNSLDFTLSIGGLFGRR